MPSSPVTSGGPPAAGTSREGPRSGAEPHAAEVGSFARRSVVGFVAVVLGAVVLALAVQSAADPLLRVDQRVAGSLNTVVAPRSWSTLRTARVRRSRRGSCSRR